MAAVVDDPDDLGRNGSLNGLPEGLRRSRLTDTAVVDRPAAADRHGARRGATPEADAQPETDATPETDAQPETDATPETDAQPETDATPEANTRPEVGLPLGELDLLVGGAHHDPHQILGPHPAGGWTILRALRPDATAVTALVAGVRHPMTRLHSGGVFGVALPGAVSDYQLEASYPHATHLFDDPYRHAPTLGEIDLHLISEGRHERLWTVLGAHLRALPVNGRATAVAGVSFAVWAPNARGLRVVGDFDFWDGRALPMRSLGSTGVWELFVPGVEAGTRYKYEILGADSTWRQKADPMAFATERPPATASVVAGESSHTWNDGAWLERRADTAWHAAPISVYEVHLGSWRRGLSYRELAEQLVDYVLANEFTHVEFLPVAEHPFGGSWGYQVTSYYAPTSRFGSPDDFRHLVDALHAAGIGVIVDWVPAHFPRDAFALGRFDGTPLYEHPDPRRGEQPDWGTYVFDFGRPEVRNFLVANALFWLEEFHVDALRVDAVASMLYLDYSRPSGEWLPNRHGGRENLEAVEFLQEVNATVYRVVPGAMMIAEESTAWPGVTRPTHLGGLGFGFKWNMGWMHDTLDYSARAPLFRTYHHHQMTFSMVYAYSENYILPFSHDEVVHGKGSLLRRMPGDRRTQLASLRGLYGYMWAHPGKQLLFMGCEFAQDNEWSEATTLDWHLLDDPGHRGVAHLVRDLNHTYRATPALWESDTEPAGFSWIDASDAESNVLAFARWSADGHEVVACVTNFSGVGHVGHRLGLPFAGRWREILNTDALDYDGGGMGNLGAVTALPEPSHGLPASATLSLPPLGTVWFRYEP